MNPEQFCETTLDPEVRTGYLGLLQLSALFGQLQDEAAQAAEGSAPDLTATLDRIAATKRSSLPLLVGQLPECAPSLARRPTTGAAA